MKKRDGDVGIISDARSRQIVKKREGDVGIIFGIIFGCGLDKMGWKSFSFWEFSFSDL